MTPQATKGQHLRSLEHILTTLEPRALVRLWTLWAPPPTHGGGKWGIRVGGSGEQKWWGEVGRGSGAARRAFPPPRPTATPTRHSPAVPSPRADLPAREHEKSPSPRREAHEAPKRGLVIVETPTEVVLQLRGKTTAAGPATLRRRGGPHPGGFAFPAHPKHPHAGPEHENEAKDTHRYPPQTRLREGHSPEKKNEAQNNEGDSTGIDHSLANPTLTGLRHRGAKARVISKKRLLNFLERPAFFIR